ncbi:HXXEE domain-containing protein [Sphingorhabdus sp. EL138]|uniref:HXXEE domain-containing protein n=1 Tax=Sphingorhabdus sp. EL138 TaxID=2073156 RepID=UPI000D69ABA2|nr:HXXEE domain-containing protein [Sphingorhabdus sp. EL138]
MPRLSFQTSLLFAPLAYAIHHGEENLLLDFRAWRLSYFPDNNALTTEAMLTILMGVTFVYLILNSIFRNRVSTALTIGFLMGSQVANAIFHVVTTIIYQDYSPGMITSVLLYLPVNFLIWRVALKEELTTPLILFFVFIMGGVVFLVFEAFGPIVLLIATLVAWILMIVFGLMNKSADGESAQQAPSENLQR